jgi:hypothetical protein
MKEDEVGRICSTHGITNSYKVLENLKGSDPLGVAGVEG